MSEEHPYIKNLQTTLRDSREGKRRKEYPTIVESKDPQALLDPKLNSCFGYVFLINHALYLRGLAGKNHTNHMHELEELTKRYKDDAPKNIKDVSAEKLLEEIIQLYFSKWAGQGAKEKNELSQKFLQATMKNAMFQLDIVNMKVPEEETKYEIEEFGIIQKCMYAMQQKTEERLNALQNCLTDVKNYLKQLNEQRKKFIENGFSSKEYKSTQKICEKVEDLCDLYVNDLHFDDTEKYAEEITKIIKEEYDTLKEHRGPKRLLANLLYAIGTLFVGYLVHAAIKGSWAPLHPDTKSSHIADELLESVKKLPGSS